MAYARYKNIGERIRRNITVDINGCWNWNNALNKWGYAKFTVGSRTNGTRRPCFVHRASYEWFVGPIPKGKVIDHLCRNNRCQNPSHLEPVTSKMNNDRNPNLPSTKNMLKLVCPKCCGPWTQLKNRRQCKPCTLKYYKEYNDRRT